MKKYLTLLLVLALLVCAGCTQQPPDPTVPSTEPSQAPSEPTEATDAPTEPTETEPPVPETTEVSLKANGTPVVLLTLSRGDVVELVGEFDETHNIVKAQDLYGLVEKRLLRTAAQEAYTPWTGYAYSSAPLYAHHQLQGEPIQTLTLNTTVEILEDLGSSYLVRCQDTLGCMKKSSVSASYITYSGGSSGGADGGDIELRQPTLGLLASVPQSGEVTGQATVLTDGVDLIACYLGTADPVLMVTEDGFAEPREGYVPVYLSDVGLIGYVPASLLKAAGDEAYTPWDGYANFSAEVYDNFYLLGDPMSKPAVNTAIDVVEELESCYVIEFNGTLCYMAKNLVSRTPLTVGGGDSGGEWSPPAM